MSAAGGVVTGNVTDKRAVANPVARRLVARFDAALEELLALARPGSLLDVGCGEGVLTERWARALRPSPVVGVDLDGLQDDWRRHAAPDLEYRVARAEALPFADGTFAAAAAVEVLEHVADPERALAEMARVAREHLVVSVPREPLWRVLNVARGAYVRELGNTPGHVHHWSRRGLLRLLAPYGEVVRARSPLPWTMVLVRLG